MNISNTEKEKLEALLKSLIMRYGLDSVKEMLSNIENSKNRSRTKEVRYDDYWREENSLDDYDYDPLKPFLIKDTKSGKIYKGHIVNAFDNITGLYDDYDNILEEVGELVLYVPEIDKNFYFFCDNEGYDYYTADPRTIYESSIQASDAYIKHLIDGIKDEYGNNTIISDRFKYIGQR